jgi:hypothetical protein
MMRAMRSCLVSLSVYSPDRRGVMSLVEVGAGDRVVSYLGLLGKLQPGHYEGYVRCEGWCVLV